MTHPPCPYVSGLDPAWTWTEPQPYEVKPKRMGKPGAPRKRPEPVVGAELGGRTVVAILGPAPGPKGGLLVRVRCACGKETEGNERDLARVKGSARRCFDCWRASKSKGEGR